MAGKKGMKRPSFSHVIRRQIWRSIRIMRRFSQPDLLRTVPDATAANVKKYLSQLVNHGYVAKDGNFVGGRAGEFQIYRLVRNPGPDHPTRCDVCGEGITCLTCQKEAEKETEKERDKEASTESTGAPKSTQPLPEVTHDAA